MDTRKCGINTKPIGVKMRKNRKYTKEFKLQAIELAEVLGNASRAAKQLGVTSAHLHTWKKLLATEVKPDNLDKESEEVLRLKKENEELKKVNYILKRAAAFFSQDHLK